LDLQGKVAVITGAARGQGEAIARRFVDEGASVFITDVLTAEGEAVAASLGAAAVFRPLDVASEAAWRQGVEEVTSSFGGVDILVNNAGIAQRTTIEETTLEDYLHVVMVNQVGPWLRERAVSRAVGLCLRAGISSRCLTRHTRCYRLVLHDHFALVLLKPFRYSSCSRLPGCFPRLERQPASLWRESAERRETIVHRIGDADIGAVVGG